MTPVSGEAVTIGIDIGTTAVKAVAVGEDGEIQARTRIPHQLRVPDPDRFEHDADQAWRQGPRTALERLARPDAATVTVSGMVPSLTAVDTDGRPITPGLLYGDVRGRVPAGGGALPQQGETAEFLRWTAREAPDAAGYWPAAAVANNTLSGAGVVDFATAATAFPLFDGTGWSEQGCADCGATADRMPRVEAVGTSLGSLHGSDTVLAVGTIDALCEHLVAGTGHDGEVLVLCGTTLIVWATIP